MISPFAVFLPILASVGPTVIPIDDSRFRVRIVYDDQSARGHVNAQLALAKAAKGHCQGKGSAVSEGTLELNKAEPLRAGKEALELSEVYSCQPKG